MGNEDFSFLVDCCNLGQATKDQSSSFSRAVNLLEAVTKPKHSDMKCPFFKKGYSSQSSVQRTYCIV
jgi:hypothetical protein